MTSWKTLQGAAKILFFEPITSLQVEENCLPDIYYHRECRSTFTHKKALVRLQKQAESPAHNAQEIFATYSLRQEHSHVYGEICIFCAKKSKYTNETHRRKPLI